jgi:C4-dicarboxylate-specific signal transduction histidine kinase
MPKDRRHAAIMFTDIVGYTTLMGKDSAKALELVRISKEIQKFSAEKSNSPGIPENIKYKIFQPFFTTKPTGSGTGLGLSLSYDIVKAHGGELKVESPLAGDSGLGAEFILHLPI